MPLMIKLNRNVVRVYLCLDYGHFITVYIKKTIYMHINRIQCRLFNCSYDALSEFYAYSRYKRDYNTYNMFSIYEYEYIADVSYP